MPKIDWDKPIETERGTPLKLLKICTNGSEMVEVKSPDGGIGWSSMDGDLGNGGWVRNVQSQPQSLHIEPAPDNFETESPIRAFTEFRVDGLYAIGMGLRPSLAHLTKYLDAMETKEGWQLVQILESATAKPSFVFRKVL